MKRVKSDVEKGHDKTRREKNRARAKLAEREWHLKTKYGLTLADYALLLEQHNGLVLCAVNRPHKDGYSTLIMTMKQDMSEDSSVTNAIEVSEH